MSKIKIDKSIREAIADEKAEAAATGRERAKSTVTGQEDLLTNLGDLSGAEIADITYGKNFDAVSMDYVATFRLACVQGMSPIKALMAMVQATAVVMGECIVAGLKPDIAKGMVKFMVLQIIKSEKKIRVTSEKPN